MRMMTLHFPCLLGCHIDVSENLPYTRVATRTPVSRAHARIARATIHNLWMVARNREYSMDEPRTPQAFNTHVVRRMWYQDTWYYSVIDVVAVLTESVNPNRYWNTLKSRLQGEGAANLLGQILQLKLQSRDNRLRLTDVASRETLLRIIQSIPS